MSCGSNGKREDDKEPNPAQSVARVLVKRNVRGRDEKSRFFIYLLFLFSNNFFPPPVILGYVHPSNKKKKKWFCVSFRAV